MVSLGRHRSLGCYPKGMVSREETDALLMESSDIEEYNVDDKKILVDSGERDWKNWSKNKLTEWPILNIALLRKIYRHCCC